MRRPTGVIIAPPMPCTMRASTNSSSELRQRAADRAEDEHDDGEAEHVARAEAVGGPAARRDADGEREQVGGDGELERQRIGAERARDRRQRGRDHGRVHVLHEQRDRDDERDDAVVRPRRGLRACAASGWRQDRLCSRRKPSAGCWNVGIELDRLAEIGDGAGGSREPLADQAARGESACRMRIERDGAIDVGERLGVVAGRDNAPRRDCRRRARVCGDKLDGARVVGDGVAEIERARAWHCRG